MFCGNLSRKITEEELKTYLPGIVFIKWITDKETGEFYGSSFIEMKDASSAAMAVLQDKSKFMGRPLKIYYCPPRPGDQWPPKEGQRTGGKQSSANSSAVASGNPPGREKTPKPDGCRKLYMGNLSYDIDDDTIVEFFKDCGTMIGLRWLTRKDTGEFRVRVYLSFELCVYCGFISSIWFLSIYLCIYQSLFPSPSLLLEYCRDVDTSNLRPRKMRTGLCCWIIENCSEGTSIFD